LAGGVDMEAVINGTMQEIIIRVFGAGLGTGFVIFLLSNGISSALKIIKV
jgi:hypothetical protein